MKQLFYNGRIYSLEDSSYVTAMLVEDSSIISLGTEEEMRKLAGSQVLHHDLAGNCVLPGFQDSHCHLLLTGMQQEVFDLTGVTSTEELIKRGQDFIRQKKIKKGDWVTGRGFNQHLFAIPDLPDKTIADAISTEHPILLDRICGHVGTLNSLALRILSINEETYIPGGEISHGRDGSLTGIFYETALTYVKSRIPKPDKDKLTEIIKNACAYANSLGLTSVHSNDVNCETLDEFMEILKDLEETGKLTLRIFEEIQASSLEDINKLEEKNLHTGDGSDFFKIGNVKLFTDGSLGAHSAYMREDYTDTPGNRGIHVYKDEELTAFICKADKIRMQAACHAIGDGAVLQCLQAMETAQKENKSGDLRHRIVHCQLADDSILKRMREAHIASDIQPAFVITDWPVAEKAFGDRVKDSYRWKTMLDLGIHLGGGSDSPVESLSPIWGIHCAVNRTDAAGSPPGGWHPDEKLSVAEALSLYTKGPAYLSFEEKRKGTLKPSGLADFVVLSEDIFQIPPERIKDIEIIMTVVGGTICYSRTEA